MSKLLIRGLGLIEVPRHRFGRLTVVRELEPKHRKTVLECICDCGNSVTSVIGDLTRGKTKSCGCFRRDNANGRDPKHGDARNNRRAPEYRCWRGIIERCENLTHHSFSDYGGRGISICARWRLGEDGRSGYECFLRDMGRKPDQTFEIDRRDNNGNYEPGNCHWVTKSAQQLNKRNNRFVAINGENLPFTEAHRKYGVVSLNCAWARVWRGMDPATAISTPKMREWNHRHAQGAER